LFVVRRTVAFYDEENAMETVELRITSATRWPCLICDGETGKESVKAVVADRDERTNNAMASLRLDPAIVAMLAVVESHSLSSCAGRAISPAPAYGYSVGAQEEG
jgi:hypothetical protein